MELQNNSTLKVKSLIFCSKCGERLIRKKYKYGFSTETGEPFYGMYLKCPNKSLWDSQWFPHTDGKYPLMEE